MKLAVEGTGYRSAAEAFVDGNQQAARVGVDLVGDLSGYAGMAGDDATATDFAASYDEAAAAAVEVLAELVGGFASLARLSDASLLNHAVADGAPLPSPVADRCSVVHLPAPPSSLGSDSSTLPGWATTVLDLLEGVFWPDADTDRLRAAASTWRGAASSVGLLSAHCSAAAGELAVEVSPEVPLALATTEDLRSRVESLADQLEALASACEEHAAQVDAKREEILDELGQLALELGIGAVVSGVVTFLTAGSAAPAAGAAGAARVAAASAKLRGILESLAFASRGTAAGLKPVGSVLRDTRAYLARLSAARTERGSASLGSFFVRGRWEPGWLARHEAGKHGHTIRDHVGKSLEELADRLARKPSMTRASSYPDQATAERAVEQVLRDKSAAIREWLVSGGGKEDFTSEVANVGEVLVRGAAQTVPGERATIVLIRDESMPDGWRLLSSFPEL